MSRRRSRLPLFFIATLFTIGALTAKAYAVPTTYYVSPLGNDSSNGTSPATPWKTIAKVNSAKFGPGDTLLLDGGNGAFAGCLSFSSSNVTSTSALPFTVSVYNGTQWGLKSNCAVSGQLTAAVLIEGISGFVLQKGVVAGNGTHTPLGVWIRNYYSPAPADNIIVQYMDVSDFNAASTSGSSSEVYVTGYPGKGLTHVQILNNVLHGLTVTSPDDNGIDGYGNGENIGATYAYNTIYNIGGHANAPNGTSGNGIWCNGTASCEVAHNYIHDIAANANTCGGPVGIGTWFANNSYVHDNEVYRVHATTWSSSACDFGALDADGGSTNSIWERNYTHHNDGPAISFYGVKPWANNTFRLNVSEEDNLVDTDGGGIWALSPTSGGYVYNNTAYRSLNMAGSLPYCVSLGYNGVFGPTLVANNSCTITASMWGLTGGVTDNGTANQSAVTFMNNNYYLTGGRPFFYWRGTQFINLAAFQAVTGEDANSVAVNPALLAAGSGGNCNGSLNGTCPSVYRLTSGSPLMGRGANLSSSVSLPAAGYYLNSFQNKLGYNIGADSSQF